MQTIKRASTLSEHTLNQLEEGMGRWRQSLPLELRHCTIQEWNIENFWVLILDARSHVSECIMHRTLRDTFRSRDAERSRRAGQRLQHSMLELDATIDRIMVHELVGYCPMFL